MKIEIFLKRDHLDLKTERIFIQERKYAGMKTLIPIGFWSGNVVFHLQDKHIM